MKKSTKSDLRCAHYASRYLSVTQYWLYQAITSHKKYKPLFVTREKENFNLYPFPSIFSLDDYSKIRQVLELLFFKVFGYFFL